MEESSLNLSSGSSPTQASRIEKAIKRYEEEIQAICRSGAQVRASFQAKSTTVSSDQTKEEADSMRKLQLRLQGLEDYVRTLEGKVRDSSVSAKPNRGSDRLETDVQPSLPLILAENSRFREEIESLRQDLKQSEKKSTRLEGDLNAIRSELATTNQENARLASNYRSLEARYRLLKEEYEELVKSHEGSFLKEKVKSLEDEIEKYREQIRLRDDENSRMVRKMHDFVRESEDVQDHLRRRIVSLEAEQPLRSMDSRTRLDRSDLDPPPRRDRSSSSTNLRRYKDSRSSLDHYNKPAAPRRKGRSFADNDGSCDKCGRRKHKDRMY